MLKVLGILVFCGLLSTTSGAVPGIRSALNDVKMAKVVTDTLTKNGLLENNLKNLGLSDIPLGGLLGLLGNIVGLKPDKAVITGSVVVLLNEKAEVHLSVRLDISGNAILPLSSIITISVDANVKFAVEIKNFSDGKFDFVISACEVTLGAIDVKLLGGLLTLPQISTIQKSLTADLLKQTCAIVNNVYAAAHQILLNSLNVALPLGNYGNLKFQLAALPSITPTYVGIDLIVAFQYAASGVNVSIPDTAVSIAVPSLDNNGFCLSISPAAMNILLYVVTPKVPLELINSLTTFSKAEELKNTLLALVPPGVLPDLPTSDLSLKITIGASPVIAFDTTGGNVTLIADVEILSKKADGSKVSVVAVRCRISLKATISLVNGKLILGLSLSKNMFTLVSSGAGITDISSLLGPINGLVNEVILPVLNGPLSNGLPLPTMLGIPLLNATIKTVVNALVICL
ncbi:BPI fold-containing family B member 4 [Anolis carolinensis]|uniref:BPI fold-containing family B member 4 n=1 Tax=Anolis carolinensis TaxID=28377 RepID=UPI000203B1B4